MKTIGIALVGLISYINLNAQNKWNLQQCIEHAIKNNLGLKQAEINTEIAAVNYNQSIAGVLPNLNAGANNTNNIGKTIDKYTNTFANSNVLSQNFYLATQVTLWNGLAQYNNIKQNEYSSLATKENVEQLKNDLSLNVATSFLQVVYNKELIGVAENQVKISKEQLDRSEKLAEAGSIAKNTVYDVKAQLANDEYSLTAAQNNYNIALLGLKQLLNLDTVNNFDIERPDLEMSSGLININTTDVYQTALKNQHSIKSAEFNLKAFEKGHSAALGRVSPTLSFNATIGTGYSGLAVVPVSYSLKGANLIGYTASGVDVYEPNFEVVTKKKSFESQFNDNVNKSFSFTLSFPLFNGLQNYSSIKTTKLQLLNAKYNYDLKKQQLYKTIAQAYADAQASLNKYTAAKTSNMAAQESFNFTQQKFNAGVLSSFDFNTAKNRLLKSQADVLNAKYDYIFKLKVLDFYQGKPLTF